MVGGLRGRVCGAWVDVRLYPYMYITYCAETAYFNLIEWVDWRPVLHSSSSLRGPPSSSQATRYILTLKAIQQVHHLLAAIQLSDWRPRLIVDGRARPSFWDGHAHLAL